MRRAFAFLLCAATLAFLILSPPYIAQGVRGEAEAAEPRYAGILTLWHVVDFKTGGTSGISYLSERVRAFERANPRVFITTEALTAEEAGARVAAGELPDLVSFPAGFFANGETLLALPRPEGLKNEYALCGMYGGEHRAYPYMADFYVLAANGNVFSERGESAAFGHEFSREAFFSALQALSFTRSDGTIVVPLAVSRGFGLPSAGLLALTLGSDATFAGEVTEKEYTAYAIDYNGLEAFTRGEAAMALCAHSEYRAIEGSKASSLLDLSEYTGIGYTDRVQYIAAASSGDALKNKICADFCAFLLSPASAKKLASAEMLPTTELTDMFSDAPFLFLAYNETHFVPNCFTPLSGEAQASLEAALLGVSGAEERFFEQLESIK